MKFKLSARILPVIGLVVGIFLSLSLNVEAVKDSEEGLKTKTLKVAQANQKMIIEMRELIKKNNDLLIRISAQVSECRSDRENK